MDDDVVEGVREIGELVGSLADLLVREGLDMSKLETATSVLQSHVSTLKTWTRIQKDRYTEE